MECIIGFGTTIITEVAKCTLVSAIPAFHYQIDVNELNSRNEEFGSRKKELQDQVDAAKSVGDIILDIVEKWLTEAGSLSQELEDFRKDERQRANHRCFYVSFPNLVSRHRLSKRAKKLAEKLVSKIEAARPITQVSNRPALQAPLQMIGDYMAFQSRKETLESIMDALKNPEVSKIGVYGMGGIGKTMLAKEVARRATNEKLFSDVAMPSVSQTPDIQKIQQEIAEKIGLRLNEVQSIRERAHRLQCQLKEKKDILIILDDIWERLDLIEVGIHFDQDQKGCKILLTSRDRDCVRSSMNAEKNFQVKELSSDEATDLFNRLVGDTLVGRPDLQQRATEVVRECGGLPIALTTVAAALKHKDLHRWNDALQHLRSCALKSIPGMSENVYNSIKLSYKFLEDDDGRQLLLLCSLHEEDMSIDVEDLMRYCVGWGLFPNIRTLEGVRTRVHSLVEILKDRSLLLDGKYYGTVKMHDIIRDVAISISSEDERGMRSVMFDELEDRMKRKELSNSKAISVLGVGGDNPARLPEKLECPRLELLLFMTRNNRRYDSTCISADFFAESKELKTLSWLPFIESMPSSFLSLQNLQTLCLRSSKLKDVDFIGDLKNLRILDLSDSSIERLSRKMGQLTNLQLLDLRGCEDLEVIEPDAIRNLTRLEELYMAETFQGWEVGEDGIGERRNASLTDLKNLHQLTVLHLNVKDAKILPREFSEKLNGYRISIGDVRYRMCVIGISRSLYLKFNQGSQLIEFGTERLIKGCEALLLDGLMGIHNAFSDSDSEGFRQLKRLDFRNNKEVQYILSSVDHIRPCNAFQSLWRLELSHLENLERICQGKLTSDSFNNLRIIEVDHCGRLKNLLPLSIVKRLRIIRVFECEILEEIVTPGRELDAHSISNNECGHEVESFELLRSLHLSSLPKFVQFCSCELEATCGSSSPMDSPKPLFSEKVLFPNLVELYLSGMILENFWPANLQANSYMKNLTRLEVKNCNSLKYLFSFAVGERLVNLIKLRVDNCTAMEDIVVTKKEEGIGLKNFLFPQLEDVTLSELPALKRFCAIETCIKFLSILRLHIKSCPELKTFVMPIQVSIDNKEVNLPLFNEKVLFPNLKYLYLRGMRVENLWPAKLQANSYMKNLTNLEVESCNNLKYLFSFVVNERLVNLKILKVDKCTAMEDIIVTKREEGIGLKNILFPKLEDLMLSELPTLKKFCAAESCIEFPSLLQLHMRDCSKLKTFFIPIQGSIDNKEVNLPLFNEKVLFPNLEDLYLSGMGVENLWPVELQVNSYIENIKKLEVKSCNSLKYLFSFAVNERLVNPKELKVDNCTAMEDIVVTKRAERIRLKNIIFPKLEDLMLIELPALKKFCATESCIEFPSLLRLRMRGCSVLKTFVMPIQVSIDNKEVNLPLFNEKVLFPNLESLCLSRMRVENLLPTELQANSYLKNLTRLEVTSCNSLKYLFSFAVNESLVNLKILMVDNCTAMEDIIVTKRKEGIGLKNFLFPKLEDLTLSKLPALKSFCAAESCIEFPSLLRLHMRGCSKLKTFVMPIQVSIDNKEVNLSFFTEKVIFPKLERLTCWGWCEAVNEIFGMSQSSIMSAFRNLKYLSVTLPSHDKPIAVSIFNFLQRYQNIETLELIGLERILCEHQHQQQQQDETYKPISTPLKKLRLWNAPMQRHLFGDPENSEPSNAIAFQTLEDLNVHRCSRLQSFSQSFMSFRNLKSLQVSECDALTYLFASSTAATLVHLEKMMIINCKGMREIINRDYYQKGEITESEHDGFVFKRLERLELHDLPSLKSFYSGNKDIRFPSLERLSIRQCPKLSNFSHGIISTSGLLKAIIAEDGVKFWDNDVNTTVRKLWVESSNLELEHLSAHETS